MRPLLVDQFNRPVLRASGDYEGAMMQRRLKAFVPSRQSINSLLSHAGDNLVARSQLRRPEQPLRPEREAQLQGQPGRDGHQY